MTKINIDNTEVFFYYYWEWFQKLPKYNDTLYNILEGKEYISIGNKKYEIIYAGKTNNFFSSNNNLSDVKKYSNHYCLILKFVKYYSNNSRTFTSTGILKNIYPIKSGTKNNISWSKQNIIIETKTDDIKKDINFVVWANKLKILEKFKLYDNVTIEFFTKTHEFNKKIYKDFILKNITYATDKSSY